MAIKTIVEPLPESTLHGLLKREVVGCGHTQQQVVTLPVLPNSPQIQSDSVSPHSCFTIKFGQDELGGSGLIESMVTTSTEGNSPNSMVEIASPVSPASSGGLALPKGGGKLKAGYSKKKQDNSTTIIKAATPSIQVSEDDDLSGITSLETRVNIISQRVKNVQLLIKLKVLSNLGQNCLKLHGGPWVKR